MKKSLFTTPHFWSLSLVMLALLLVAGFLLMSESSAHAEAQDQGAFVPEVEVQVMKAQERRLWNEFSGRLEAIDRVEVRPRVGGTLTKILFDEGKTVTKGDSLFVIDPRPFEASVATAKATLAAARSQSNLAWAELKRAKKLTKEGHLSASLLDQRQRDYQVAQATIRGAEAQLKQADLDLEYAHIKAPINGQISRAEITVGNVIEAGPNAPILTTIVSKNEIYAEFDIDEQNYIQTVRRQKSGKMPVEMTLAADKNTTYRGQIYSFDNQLDTTSGTIRARAIFKNTDGTLVPGMYANIRLGATAKESLLLVNDKAISTDQSKKYVYVVSPENKVEYREVALGHSIEGQRVVLSGLKTGEQVMVNSLQRVRPGMEVKPINIAKKEQKDKGVIVGEAKADKVASKN